MSAGRLPAGMSLSQKLQVYQNCGCRSCGTEAATIRDRIACEPPAESAGDGTVYDPVMLMAGIKTPKVRMKQQKSPAHRAASRERFKKLLLFRQTTEGIARQQMQFDRSRWSRGQTVRG